MKRGYVFLKGWKKNAVLAGRRREKKETKGARGEKEDTSEMLE